MLQVVRIPWCDSCRTVQRGQFLPMIPHHHSENDTNEASLEKRLSSQHSCIKQTSPRESNCQIITKSKTANQIYFQIKKKEVGKKQNKNVHHMQKKNSSPDTVKEPSFFEGPKLIRRHAFHQGVLLGCSEFWWSSAPVSSFGRTALHFHAMTRSEMVCTRLIQVQRNSTIQGSGHCWPPTNGPDVPSQPMPLGH